MSEVAPISRRHFLASLVGTVAALGLAGCSKPEPEAGKGADVASIAAAHGSLRHGSEKVVILIYPGFTAVDAIGPEYLLSGMMGASVEFVAKAKALVATESRFGVMPNRDFADCPQEPDLFLIPGGTAGLLSAMADPETLAFIRQVGGRSKLVASVCTGSLLLGVAGLLEGYRATSHWQTLGLLPLVGATPEDARVVVDRNRLTGAGVTAGLDLALRLVREFRGDRYAQGMQLLAQYDPQPLYPGGGHPDTASPETVALLNTLHGPLVEKIGAAMRDAMSSFDNPHRSALL